MHFDYNIIVFFYLGRGHVNFLKSLGIVPAIF